MHLALHFNPSHLEMAVQLWKALLERDRIEGGTTRVA